MSDLISRKALLKHIEKIRQDALMIDDIHRANIVMTGMNLCEEAVRDQPSVQPEYTEQDIRDSFNSGYSCGKEAEIQKMQDLEQAELKKAYELGKLDAMEEQERKTGRWINDICSECGQYVWYGDRRKFCPNCGVKMEGEG